MCSSDKKATDLFRVSKSTLYHWKKNYKKVGYEAESESIVIRIQTKHGMARLKPGM